MSNFIEQNGFKNDDLKELYNRIHENNVYNSIESYCNENNIKELEGIYYDKNLIDIIEHYSHLEKNFFLNHVYFGNIDIVYLENEKLYATYVS